MDFFIDPNFAYMILVAGVLLAFFSASTPGTGVGELAAVFCFVLAGYFVFMLSIRWWAFFLLFLGIVPFIMAVRKPRQSVLYLSLCIVLEVIGSVFLFPAKDGVISVNPLLAIFVSVFMALILWYILQKFIEVTLTRPAHDLESLIGQAGKANSAIHKEGSVHVNGEDWSATSNEKIPLGAPVRVVRREGIVLVVEKDKS